MWLLSFGQAFSHGLTHEVLQGGVGVRAEYEAGDPMAFAEVRVFAPGQEEVYQEGFTDADGSFMIRAATPGPWRVEIDDGMGHKLKTTLDADVLSMTTTSPESPWHRSAEVLLGLSLIFAGSGFFAWGRQRRGRSVP